MTQQEAIDEGRRSDRPLFWVVLESDGKARTEQQWRRVKGPWRVCYDPDTLPQNSFARLIRFEKNWRGNYIRSEG